MTVIARFEVVPVRGGSMSTTIAHALRALDRFPVAYETTATDTVIEADTVDQVFQAVQAAHEAIPDDRVITSVEIDEDRRRPQTMRGRVASVEQQLGHPPRRSRGQEPQTPPPRTPPAGTPMQSPPGSASTQAPPTGPQSGGQSPPPGGTSPTRSTGQRPPGSRPPAPNRPR